MRNAHRIFFGKPEGKRTLERPRCRWKDTIKIDIKLIQLEVNWIHLAQDRERNFLASYSVLGSNLDHETVYSK
jgi:hypothetical protein